MGKVKAFLIDAEKREVREVEYNTGDGAVGISGLIGCGLFCTATVLGDGNFVYVDDEGYLNGTRVFFKFKSLDTQWFAGNGLVLKEDKRGNTVDSTVDVGKLREDILFLSCDDEESCPTLPPIRIISF